MMPQLVIAHSKKERKKYTDTILKNLYISPYNIFKIEPADGIISIDQVRDLFSLFVTQSPDMKTVILDSFDLATVEAQNSLLKLLEEKTEQALFLLFADNSDGVIPTVRSRVRIVHPENGTPKAEPSTITLLNGLIDRIVTDTSMSFLTQPDHLLKTKEDVLERIDGFMGCFKERLVRDPSEVHIAILKKILSTRKDIQMHNANPQFAYDILLIFIFKAASMK